MKLVNKLLKFFFRYSSDFRNDLSKAFAKKYEKKLYSQFVLSVLKKRKRLKKRTRRF